MKTASTMTAAKQSEEEIRSGRKGPSLDALAFIAAASEATYLLSAEGSIIAANEKAAERLSVDSSQELLGQCLFDLERTDRGYDHREIFEKVLREGSTELLEDKSGDRYEKYTYAPVADTSETVLRVILYVADVTNIYRWDEELRREQQRQIFYMESLPGFVFLLGEDYSIRYANRYFRQQFGRPLSRKCFEVIHQKDDACLGCAAIDVFKSQSPVQWEWTYTDGRTFHLYAHPMTDVDLSPVVMVMGIDITARKMAEDALKLAQRYQQAILDNIPDLVWLKNEAGKFVAVNNAFASVCGVPQEELIGKTDVDAWDDGETAKIFQYRDDEVIRLKEPKTTEEAIVTKEGEVRWMETIRVPILTSDGGLDGLTAIAHDITERKKTVDQLMYSHSEMEKHVRERTAELEKAVKQLEQEIEERKRTEEKLVQARKRAEVATRAKSQFLANMSHEIRTPLNVILGMTEMSLTCTDIVDQHRALEMVRESGTSLLAIINDILDFSKIEARKLVLEELHFDLWKLLEMIKQVYSYPASKKNLRLDLQISPDVPHVIQGDPNRLRQVLNNLLANAVKFTEQGAIIINVWSEGECSVTGMSHVSIAVTDTGIGIAEEQRKIIFESFQQADGSTTRQYGGTGLGLTISKRLVALMGGSLTLKSREAHGSTFTCRIPFKLGEQDKVIESDSGTEVKDDLRPPQKARILLAEDNALNRELATRYLRGRNSEVLVATNGQEALDMLKNEKVDLVLMDVQMPILDGISATEQIRASTDLAVPSDIPIIAMTAHALPGDKKRFLEVGMTGYISKPIELKKLSEVIAATLQMQDAPKDAGASQQEPATAADEQSVSDENVNFEQTDPEQLESGITERAKALQLLQDNEKLLRRLEKVFLRDADQDLTALRLACEKQDKSESIRLAHMLKGASSTIGAGKASALARDLEYALNLDNHEHSMLLFQSLAREMKVVCDFLQKQHEAMD